MSHVIETADRSAPGPTGPRKPGVATFMPPSPPGVAAGYRHHDRLVTPGTDVTRPGTRLKWYDLRIAGNDVPAEIDRAARDAVGREIGSGLGTIDVGQLGDAGDAGDATLGLVVLHVAEPITFLIIGTWRGNQELWTTSMVRPTAGGAFAMLPGGSHRPNLCVWEIAPVWHERQAWVRYLRSARDATARETFLADRLEGLV